MTRLGILTALPQEAQVVTSASQIRVPLQLSEGVVFIRTGIGYANARQSAEQLIEQGATALLSLGVCGGIDPDVKAGTVLLPETISNGEVVITVNAPWLAAIRDRLGSDVVAVASYLHVDKPVTSRQAKRALHESTLASAVDMESFAIADAANREGLPFLVIRAVVDDARMNLPRLVLAATDADGYVRTPKLLAGLLRAPLEIVTLFRLAKSMDRAVDGLRKVAQRAGPSFLCDHA